MTLWSLWRRVTSSFYSFSDIPLTPQYLEDRPVNTSSQIPDKQRALLLHGPHQEYKLTDQYPVPVVVADHELLVRVRAIGLNPIDWKAP